MSERPPQNPSDGAYRRKILEADAAAARLVEGLKNNEPWAFRVAAFLVEAAGDGPMRCENCGKTMAEHDAMAHCWPERKNDEP